MLISVVELEKNLSKYLSLAEKEDVYITSHGRIVTKLTSPYQDRVKMAESLFGILSADMTLEEARDAQLNRN